VPAADADLVRRCLHGDPAAMRELVERFQSDVYSLCARLLNNTHDAEDVAQEVFLRVFRSLGKWDATRPLRPWVIGITVNRCRTWISRRPRRPELVDFLAESTAAAPESDDGGELSEAIRIAVDNLRPEYREVFVLFHEQGRPYEEIAEAVGRPVGTVKTWLHRARAELLNRLRRKGLIQEEETPPSNQPMRRV
jgi:RNA polymerase sigma factor (sigma-70 family)